jgi:calcium binding protein 39
VLLALTYCLGRGRAGARSPADEDQTTGHTWYHPISFCFSNLSYILCNTPANAYLEVEVNQESVFQLLSFLIQEDLLYLLANNIHKLPFESRKDAQVIFSTAFRYKPAGASDPQVLHHIIQYRPVIIISLCKGYDRRESAMPCGGVLREALKYDTIAALLLYDEPTPDGQIRDLAAVNPDIASTGEGVFWKFFDWIDKGAFEVSADAFNTFRVCPLWFWRDVD